MTEDLDIIFHEVFNAKAKWKFIGLKLGVPIGELHILEEMYSDIDNRLLSVLEKWLEIGNNVTWKFLAETMGALTVGREDLKDNILVKYC